MLETARALDLPDWWIGAGFVRNAIWDHLHGFAPAPFDGDIDVIWFDATRGEKFVDEALTSALQARRPDLPWSVKNQARMHLRNRDHPYRSSVDAMCYWPETATAVAITLRDDDIFELAAPFGIDDLIAMVLRPTPHFLAHRLSVFHERQHRKNWRSRWPLLRVID